MSVIGSNALAGASGQGGGGDFVIEKSLRFTKGDGAYLSRTFSGTPNKKKFTFSVWFKGAVQHSHQYLLQTQHVSSNYFEFTLNAFSLQAYNAVPSINVTLERKLRDPSAWYHAVLAVDTTQAVEADRLKIYLNGEHQTDYASGASTFPAQNAEFELPNRDWYIANAFFNSTSQSANFFDGYMAEFHYVDGEAKDVTDFGAFDDSGVWQAAEYTGSHGTNGFHLDFANGSNLGNDAAGSNNWTANNLTGVVPVISSPNRPTWNAAGGWSRSNNNYDADYATSGYNAIQATLSASTTYHFFLRFKDTGASYGGWYFNSASSVPSSTVPDELGGNTLGLRTGESSLGTHGTYATANGTSSGQNQISVTALQSSGNGEHIIEFVVNTTAGKVWARKAGDASWVGGGDPSNSSSTASFLIPTGEQYIGYMGYQVSSYADFTTIAGDVASLDLLRDSPTNGDPADDTEAGGVLSGNYCTWNPLTIRNGGGTMELIDGNLNFGDQGTASRYGSVVGSIAVNSGKWFVECTYGSGSGVNTNVIFGLVPVEGDATYNAASRQSITGMIALRGPHAHQHGSTQVSDYASGLAIGDTISVAFDCDNGTSTWYKNGTSLGTFPHTFDTSYSWTPCAIDWSNNTPGSSYILNCGQRPFSMTPPTGYKAICTANLPTPDIADGSTAFDVVTYASDGTSRTISGLNMSPDLVWSKRRSASARHVMSDSVRGVNKEIFPNLTNVERTSTDGLTAFNSDGYTLGDDASQYGWQSNGNTFVNWAWDAGSSTVSNTDGDITSSVRANPSAGFSIVKWTSITWSGSATNRQVGHGLGAAPAFIITKGIDNSAGWYTYHKDLDATSPNDYYLTLNTTDAKGNLADSFGPNIPDSTTFGDRLLGFSAGQDVIAYCFAPVAGYSAFGSYVGNGNNDGRFVSTNFKVKYLLTKPISAGGDWMIWDAERQPYNANANTLQANLSDAEANTSGYAVDFLSNGFKFRMYGSSSNASNVTYIYAAFAENPFQANGGLAR